MRLRRGMTIIEVLFAIVILAGVMLAMSRFGQAFTRAARDAANIAVASDLATARIEAIRGHATYGTLVSTFNGTSETSAGAANPPMTGHTGYVRTTAATRTQSDTTDFVTITVTVTAPVLSRAVRKTAVIAAFR
ncbi:MAG: type II secretion system GspH family protein [Gemmatimonadaceae bacterium]|nr:type II secretion system GspH family protein [Gemmatimonadaceae bacterium]